VSLSFLVGRHIHKRIKLSKYHLRNVVVIAHVVHLIVVVVLKTAGVQYQTLF
jgi:hypothetical protein